MIRGSVIRVPDGGLYLALGRLYSKFTSSDRIHYKSSLFTANRANMGSKKTKSRYSHQSKSPETVFVNLKRSTTTTSWCFSWSLAVLSGVGRRGIRASSGIGQPLIIENDWGWIDRASRVAQKLPKANLTPHLGAPQPPGKVDPMRLSWGVIGFARTDGMPLGHGSGVGPPTRLATS